MKPRSCGEWQEENPDIVIRKLRDNIYLWPAMPEMEKRHFIRRWKDLPTGYRHDMWVWVGRIYKDEKDVLKEIKDLYGEGVAADVRGHGYNLRVMSVQDYLDNTPEN